jgi:hypothetical protein
MVRVVTEPMEFPMTDRASATIQIGGAIRSDLIEQLIDAIAGDHGMLDWVGATIDASHIVEGATLEICAHGLTGGQFDEVEGFCNHHGIPYVRNSDPCIGAFSAQRAVHTGDGEPLYFDTNGSDHVLMSRAELNGLGSIAAANVWFEAAAFVPPPLSIVSPPDDQEPWVDRAGHPLGDWKYEVTNDDTRLGYLDWIAAREAGEAGATMPRAEAAVPDIPQLYLHLYHGRKDPDENLEDWGSEGPVIGPLAYVHTTYTLLWQILGCGVGRVAPAVWAWPTRWFGETVKDGLSDCRKAGLRWWPGDSFFPLWPV